MFIVNGVRYRLWTPKDEEKEFHPLVKDHYKEIFDKDSLYFDTKHVLKSVSGIGSIPDAYVINLSRARIGNLCMHGLKIVSRMLKRH